MICDSIIKHSLTELDKVALKALNNKIPEVLLRVSVTTDSNILQL